ncbi:hypothetical protein LGT39_09340 [Demequina sp. TTPB684]|uniref:hypothetical protein n=1 Tax=unclassified Demequina TaxID=2620311 RepID=UPI001CF5767D|nr:MULTISPECIES: hypothetical protein [unclassified Demequina]MCB2413044.1 hypothetical protein [Demequina sp. TTPB684]UPU89461.1 hypothetical protein LGT36_005915 [Demequina sp. TMPB413]
MHRPRVIALAAVVSMSLAGCASGSPEPLPTNVAFSPQATATATSSPTPSASPTPTPTPSASTPVASGPPAGNPCSNPGTTASGLPAIDFNRYASICLGMSFTEASTAMPGPPVAGRADCPWYAEVLAVDDPGLYVAAVTYPENPGDEIFLFRMNWLGDPASAASFDAPTTQQGISVGSTTAEVKKAYPAATSVTVEDPARGPRSQLVISGTGGYSLVFDVTAGHVDTVYWGAGVSQGAAGELCAL